MDSNAETLKYMKFNFKWLFTHFDGWLYVVMATCAAIVAAFTTDEAIKLLGTTICFWLKTVFGIIGAAVLAGKTYRSTSYGDQKEREVSTTVINKTIDVKQTSIEPPKDESKK